jgi:co-chaperonin GroES (HSP10)
MNIQLLENSLLVVRDEANKVSEGGLFIPETAQKVRNTGKVVAIGLDTDAKFEGKRVLFDPIAGGYLEWEGMDCIRMYEPDIRAII